MKLLYSFFIFFFATFLVIEFRVFLQIEMPNWIVFYGKDFLCMPIVLTICLVVARFVKKEKSIRLSLFAIFSLALFYSTYFEVYLARVHPRYTGDWIDVAMYFTGSVLFYFLQEWSLKNKKAQKIKN